MELFWIFLVAFTFTLAGIACMVLTVLGLPGAWILIALGLVIELTDTTWLGTDAPTTFSWTLLGLCLGLAVLGEVLELVAGMLGARKGGSSRRGAIGALIGGIVGALLGVPIPVPLVGSLAGAILGTFAGAIIGELTGDDATVRGSIKPATGATVGRVLGTLSKMPIVFAIWMALVIAAWWP